MKQCSFHEQQERIRLKGWLGKLMDVHRLVSIEKLSLDSGLPPDLVRSLLEEMIANKEAERLRPLNYEKEDMDFFRLCRARRATVGLRGHRGRRHSWERWIGTAKSAMRLPILGRRLDIWPLGRRRNA